MCVIQKWKRAIQAIATINGSETHHLVMSYRQALRPGSLSSLDVLDDIRNAWFNQWYDPEKNDHDFHFARDNVVYLVFSKLKTYSGFLDTSSLERYLQRTTRYDKEEIQAFLESVRAYNGQLRNWLCRHGYDNGTINRALVEQEINEYRQRTRRPKLSDKSAFDAILDLDHSIDIPLLIEELGHLITVDLVCGGCRCVESYELSSENSYRPLKNTDSHPYFTSAAHRCASTHFLSLPNLENATRKSGEESGGRNRRRKIDNLEFVERAAVESIHQKISKTFCDSMFAHYYSTPDHLRLRRAIHNGKDSVTLNRSRIEFRDDTLDLDNTSNKSNQHSLYCEMCRTVVRAETTRFCEKQKHVWVVRPLDEITDDIDDFVVTQIPVNICQQLHIWPAKQNERCPKCPECSEPAVVKKRNVDTWTLVPDQKVGGVQ